MLQLYHFEFKRLLNLSHDFPSESVRDAYISPTVDKSTDPFEWGKPDLDLLRQYVNKIKLQNFY